MISTFFGPNWSLRHGNLEKLIKTISEKSILKLYMRERRLINAPYANSSLTRKVLWKDILKPSMIMQENLQYTLLNKIYLIELTIFDVEHTII